MMAKNTSKPRKTGKGKKLASPIVTIVLFAAAAAMLLGSTIGGTRAALTYFSDTYTSNFQLKSIGVSLMESNVDGETEEFTDYNRVAWRDYESNGSWDSTNTPDEVGTLLTGLLGEDETFKIGKTYTEKLAVANTGSIDTYVRVIVYKYWLKTETLEDGTQVETKAPMLEPDLIRLNWVNGDLWLVDEEASTPERTVLYYSQILPAGTENSVSMTEPLCDTLTVDSAVAKKVTQETKTTTTGEDGRVYTTITTTYDYDGYQFVLEAEVDAVQTHSAEAAIWSAWGRRVTINEDKTLSLTVDRTADDVTEPEENVTEPEEGVTEPEGNVTNPEEGATEPEENAGGSEGNVTEPEGDTAGSEENITEPEVPEENNGSQDEGSEGGSLDADGAEPGNE